MSEVSDIDPMKSLEALSMTSWVEDTPTTLSVATTLATEILKDVFQFRRSVSSKNACAPSCAKCLAPHLPRVISAVMQRKPITFVLPAFPGKSPNLSKVFGPLPDMAERQALQFLNALCNRVNKLYCPGAHITLCSDGRVFSDVIGIKEKAVTDYQHEINLMIQELNPENFSTFTLEEVYERKGLMEKHGRPLEALREKVRRGGNGSDNPEDQEAHRIYCGITRFLVEDSMHPGQTKSRTAIQKECRERAYEVIRRSNAWSELIAERFPEAVRLSIHPQACGAKKLGIQLLGVESWMTPWHGVAVDTGKEFVLMKRWEAEKLNAQLVRDGKGRASHYELVD